MTIPALIFSKSRWSWAHRHV